MFFCFHTTCHRCVLWILLFLSATFLHAADPLETVVAEMFDVRVDTAAKQKAYDALRLEHQALTNRIASVRELAESARRQNSAALQDLEAMEARVANLWTRVPASHRTNTATRATLPLSPEARVSALRRDVQALAKLHTQFLCGQEVVAGRRCDILTLGLSCAIAVSDDNAFAAIATPAPDETWRWTPVPARAHEIRAAIRACQKNTVAIFPMP